MGHPGRKSVYTGVRLRSEDHEKAHAAAAALDMSLSGYLATLVRRDELDAHGRPVWASVTEQAERLPGLDVRAEPAA